MESGQGRRRRRRQRRTDWAGWIESGDCLSGAREVPLARSLSRRTDGGRRPAGAVATTVPILQSERGGPRHGRLAAFSNWDRFFTVPADQHTSTLSSDRPHCSALRYLVKRDRRGNTI